MSSGTPFSSMRFMKPCRNTKVSTCLLIQSSSQTSDPPRQPSPPPRCPGLWRSPSLSESARSEQTCEETKQDVREPDCCDSKSGERKMQLASQNSHPSSHSFRSLLQFRVPRLDWSALFWWRQRCEARIRSRFHSLSRRQGRAAPVSAWVKWAPSHNHSEQLSGCCCCCLTAGGSTELQNCQPSSKRAIKLHSGAETTAETSEHILQRLYNFLSSSVSSCSLQPLLV